MKNDVAGAIDGEVKAEMEHIYQDLRVSLSVAYDFWRRGLSSPWNGFDVQATPEESRAQYQLLIGTLKALYSLAVQRLGEARGKSTQPAIEIPAEMTRTQLLTLIQNLKARILSDTGEDLAL